MLFALICDWISNSNSYENNLTCDCGGVAAIGCLGAADVSAM